MFDCGGMALSEDKLNSGWEATDPILGGSSATLPQLAQPHQGFRLDPNAIIDGRSNSLLAPKVPFGGLN
jgi:hypothetical protein